MTLASSEPPGATPLAPEDLAGLKLSYISTRQELNEAEQANILAGLAWAERNKRSHLLSERFIRRLHERMFGGVWSWAGEFRTRETNIGLPPYSIAASLRELLDTMDYWIAERTFSDDEIAVRLHHRLVQIHPFPNGNGRHTRAMADLLIVQMGGAAFSWGRTALVADTPVRATYIAALREADRENIAPLLAFARS